MQDTCFKSTGVDAFRPLPCQFENLLYNNLYSDFTLIINNPPENKLSKIPVHRFLLDAFSSYFHKFFQENPHEKQLTLCLPDWVTPGVYLVLEHIYSSKRLLFTDNNICSIYRVSCDWAISSLQIDCLDYLQFNVSALSSLYILTHITDQLPHDSEALSHLLQLVTKNFVLFQPKDFVDLQFDLFNKIIEIMYMTRPDDHLTDHLCSVISTYILNNLFSIGSHEFDDLLAKFSMRTNHHSILDLYEISLQYNWSVEKIENKILHAWCHLDLMRLIKIPPSRLNILLRENYLNTPSEDSLLDFVIKVREKIQSDQNSDPSEISESLKLWAAIRISALSSEGRAKIEQIPEAVEALKTQISSKLINNDEKARNRRLPRENVKCLVLGAADDAALEDVRQNLILSFLTESNLVVQRADIETINWKEENFDKYHAILVFGFYKFHKANELSQKLYDFHKRGGGLILAYGSNRYDSFGLGEPLSSILPFDPHILPTKSNEIKVDVDAISIGCKNMRILGKTSKSGKTETYWDDGIPFLISLPQKANMGLIYVLNASPVSSQIIPQQWGGQDKAIFTLLVNTIVNVAGYVKTSN